MQLARASRARLTTDETSHFAHHRITNTHLSQVHAPASDPERKNRIQLGCKQRGESLEIPFPPCPSGLHLLLRSPKPPDPQRRVPAAGQGRQCLAPRELLAPTELELPWLSLSKRNFRFDLGEFLFFISAGGRGKAKKKNNNL